MKRPALVISCEHAVNTIPPAYQALFQQQAHQLQTHQGIDFGALEIAKHLSQVFACDFTQATVSRLLIDCNRSLQHAQCFSAVTRPLPAAIKQELIERYYLPFRQKTTHCIQQHIQQGHLVLHLSIHSFTPVLDGVRRNADLGLLYDPARALEKKVARLWKHLLVQEQPSYRIRMNYPYQGKSDGFTSALRKQFDEKCYVGLEVEHNQALVQSDAGRAPMLRILSQSLQKLLPLIAVNDYYP
ncbi:MAG: N-formylglutamate amidohydrolase [Legionellaceae bacterium]|nr:N-formylglutamate amidohydrolase [Legionellaceae bacterium]